MKKVVMLSVLRTLDEMYKAGESERAHEFVNELIELYQSDGKKTRPT